MFTGLIDTTGRVSGFQRSHAGARLSIEVQWPDTDAPRAGDSVAVNGACLTALEPGPGSFSADLSPETLSRTLIGALRPGDAVNLERALRVGDRVGGHFVQGHVDTVVRLLDIEGEGRFARWRLSLPSDVRGEVAEKGSVALNGVSLTVAYTGDDYFEVALIPQTLHATTLCHFRAGARLHLETDVLAKYVVRALVKRSPSAIHMLFGGSDAQG
jgi:riboflavin synthase